MINKLNLILALRLWFCTAVTLTILFIAYLVYRDMLMVVYVLGFGLAALAGSLPALVAYVIMLPLIKLLRVSSANKIRCVCSLNLIIILPYSAVAALAISEATKGETFSFIFFSCFFSLAVASAIAMWINRTVLKEYYPDPLYITGNTVSHSQNQINHIMEPNASNQTNNTADQHTVNKPLTKGLVTAGLILLMLIPTWFISNLVRERQTRQMEVVRDVASKWALEQTITGPYLYVPYYHTEKGSDGKANISVKHVLLLPDELSVMGDITPEERQRSIYKVLLYKSSLKTQGNFKLQLPKEIDTASIIRADVKICVGISDFKGIERKIDITLNGIKYDLTPGLPTNDIDVSGLSANVDIASLASGDAISFTMPMEIRGSHQLHFAPLSGNSKFTLNSAWPNPSFDGTSLPSVREVNDKGFSATWEFNKANLPFSTVLKNGRIDKESLRFGVSMLQPADQYAKTERSVKYALLIIGLTFSLFFIIELMQKRPVHPVQYVLVGLALVIFYTLLLSISEFLLFDNAYMIAAAATVLLITLYAKSHFNSWKTASIFGVTITALYGFIFVLIRLEDTALLLGSIGLFAILAAVMYASRKINWYHTPQATV